MRYRETEELQLDFYEAINTTVEHIAKNTTWKSVIIRNCNALSYLRQKDCKGCTTTGNIFEFMT
jgi:hypothetical protein